MRKLLLILGIVAVVATIGVLIINLVPGSKGVITDLKQKIGLGLNEIDKFELDNQISGYTLKVNNKIELTSLFMDLGTFQPNNGLDPKEGNVFTVKRLRLILVSQPVSLGNVDILKQLEVFDTQGKLVSNATYEIDPENGLLKFYLYIDPQWLDDPIPTQTAYSTNPRLAKEHLLNWQFLNLILTTNNKNSPKVQQLIDSLSNPGEVYNVYQQVLSEWEQKGIESYPLSL